LQANILKQVVLILRGSGATTNHFQKQSEMRRKPLPKYGFLFLCGH
jgi:hypothetical protein